MIAIPNNGRTVTVQGILFLLVLQVVFIVFVGSGFKEQYVMVFGLLPLMAIALLHFDSLLVVIPATLFYNIHYYGFSSSEFFASLLVISFLLTHRRIQRDDFGSAPYKIIGAYLALMVISAVKSIEPMMTLVLISHFVIFICLIAAVGASVRDIGTIKRLLSLFLFFVLLNSIHVMVLALLTGGRVFGFAGIMFVDYAGIGITIAFIHSLFAPSSVQRRRYGVLMSVFVTALILTQTRTSWISTFVIVSLLSILIWKNESAMGLTTGTMRRIVAIGVIVLAVGFMVAVTLNPDTFQRLGDVSGGSDPLITETGDVKNSLVSRLLLWHTAYNAFIANPFLGIGAYSFPLSSMYFYTIPEPLFAMYVETLTPHQTVIAVLVETGIIGLIVFSLMIRAVGQFVWRVVKKNMNHPDRSTVYSVGSGILYILVSMLTTDAWLWGHGIVLFGILMGFIVAIDRLSAQ